MNEATSIAIESIESQTATYIGYQNSSHTPYAHTLYGRFVYWHPMYDAASYGGVASVSRIIKLQVSFAKEPYKRDDILQERRIILSMLLTVATTYLVSWVDSHPM